MSFKESTIFPYHLKRCSFTLSDLTVTRVIILIVLISLMNIFTFDLMYASGMRRNGNTLQCKAPVVVTLRTQKADSAVGKLTLFIF